MRKFTLFLMSLFLSVGAMAQTPIKSADFDATKTYRIYNKAVDKGDATWKAMAHNTNGGACLKSYDADDNAQLWQFVDAGEGKYYIYNANLGKYLDGVGGNSGVRFVNESDAVPYSIVKDEDGDRIAFYHSDINRPHNYLWNDGNNNLFGWKDATNQNHMFYLEEGKSIEFAAAREAFNAAYAAAADMLTASGYTATEAQDLPLQTTEPDSPYYIWTNAQEQSEGPIDQLVDGNTGNKNFFHTQWSQPVPAGPHYIEVDLGENCDLDEFIIRYSTRINSDGTLADFPDVIEIQGSNEKNGTYTTLATFNENLPQEQGKYWESTVVKNDGYRFLRFNVTAEKTFWHMSEFDITIPASESVNKEYEELIDEVRVLNEAYKNASDNAGYTYTKYVEATNALTTALAAIYPRYTLNVTNAGWATLFLDYNTVIPSNVKAYIVSSVNSGYVTLTQVTGVLPKHEGVLVEAKPGNYDFVKTSEESDVDYSLNWLEGTLIDADIQKSEGWSYYVLGMVDGEVGLYKPTYGDDNTKFKNGANKAYLVVKDSSTAPYYSFRFEDGTTAIENVEVENEVKAIYDLTGRRVEAITAPGIYIVNGKKVLVK